MAELCQCGVSIYVIAAVVLIQCCRMVSLGKQGGLCWAARIKAISIVPVERVCPSGLGSHRDTSRLPGLIMFPLRLTDPR